jgi:hypothetical protein
MSKSAIFLLRSYPDIDHITPIIYKLSQETTITSEIIFVRSQIPRDYRINFLRRQRNVHISNLRNIRSIKNNDTDTLNRRAQIGEATYNKIQEIKDIGSELPTDIPRLIWRVVTSSLPDDLVMSNTHHFPEAPTIFDTYSQYNQFALLFDWPGSVSSPVGRFIQDLITEAKSRDVATAALPHGDEGYINYLKYTRILESSEFDPNMKLSKLAEARNDDNRVRNYDYYISPSNLRAEKYQAVINTWVNEEIRILGSPRYCDEWIEINSRISPEYCPDVPDKDFNILFFLAKRTIPIFWNEVQRSIKALSKLHGTNLVIKGHPRSDYADIDQIRNNSEYTFLMEDERHSVSLINWADVVVSLGGSIDFSAVVRELPLLEMEYLHANHSIVASYAPSTQIDCRDEMINLIKDLRDGNRQCTYSEVERRQLLDEVVAADDAPPLSNYVSFITEIMQ